MRYLRDMEGQAVTTAQVVVPIVGLAALIAIYAVAIWYGKRNPPRD